MSALEPLAERTNLVRRLRFSSVVKDTRVEEMLHSLSPEDLQVAARSSYEYLNNPNPLLCRDYARKMATRYLASNKEKTRAFKALQKTIAFRREMDIDGLRQTFDDPASKYREPLQKRLSSKVVYVQGYDIDGRSTYVFVPRLVQGHDSVWTIKQHVWTLERAIACSKARDKTVNAVIDFNGFSPIKHSPPIAIGKQFMQTLRFHYVGHIHQIFLVDAPSSFNLLWRIFKPLLSTATKNKIQFVNSPENKEKAFGKLYSKNEAASWMMPSGRKNRPLDMEEYLFDTPFDQAFDE
jgi:hypothetical protein